MIGGNNQKYIPLVNAKEITNANVTLNFTTQKQPIIAQPLVQYMPVYQGAPYPTNFNN